MPSMTVLLIMMMLAAISPTDACSVDTSKYRKLSMGARLVGADFVVMGVDKKRFNVMENGENVTKALFEVYCVFKPLKSVRNVSNEIVITRLTNRDSCSVTNIVPGEKVIIGLRELPCVSAPGSDCEFEYHEINALQSAAFNFTDRVRDITTRTCGLQSFRPPKYCKVALSQNLCPARPVVARCIPASATNLSVSSYLILCCLTVFIKYVQKA